MKNLPSLLVILAVFGLSLASSSAEANWLTNYHTALTTAAKQGKPVLINFTGSDWCPWCIKMDKDIFAKPAFEKFANDNLVLLKLDFPQETELPPWLQKQNLALLEKYDTQGAFPTIILLNPMGTEIARNMGAFPGGPDAFIAWIKNAQKS